MKNFLLSALLLVFFSIDAQNKLSTTKCAVYFEASVPLFEAVEAKNDDVHCTLLLSKSEITYMAVIKKFKFRRNLMQEHFNTNYMESDRYSTAVFKGNIEKFDLKEISQDAKNYIIKGKITIHGQSRIITVTAVIKKAGNGIHINSSFALNTDDFNIEIPHTVLAKISKNVNIQTDCILN